MHKLNLQQFAGTLTVTIIKDVNAHWTAASASPASSLAEGDSVALTVTPASGYELDEIEVIAGGVTITYTEDDGYGFEMGESNVTLYFKSKATSTYRVVENTIVCINGGAVTELKRDMILEYGVNGAIIGVGGDPTSLSSLSADIISALLKSGAIAAIPPKQKKVAPAAST